MKKVFALMMVGVITLSTQVTVAHAESNVEWSLEDEVIITDDTFQSRELLEDDFDQALDIPAASLWYGWNNSSKV